MITKKLFSRRALLQVMGATPVVWGLAGAARAADDASAPPALDLYGKLPQVEAVCLSPAATHVAMIYNQNGQKYLFIHDFAGSKPIVNALPGALLRDLLWVDDATVLMVGSQNVWLEEFVGDKSEYDFAVMIDINSTKRLQLFNQMEGFRPVVMGDLHRVHDATGWRVTAANVRLGVSSQSVDEVAVPTPILYSFALDGQRTMIDSYKGDVQSWAVTSDGHAIGRCEHDRNTHVWTLRYRQDGPWKIIYTEKVDVDVPSLMGLGRDGKSLLVYRATGPQGHNFFEVDPTGVFSAPLEAPSVDARPIFHPVTRALAGFSGTDSKGAYVYTFFDPLMGKLPDMVEKALPGSYFNNIVSYGDDPRRVIVYSEGPTDSGSFYFIDFTTGGAQLAGQTYPDIPTNWVGEKKPFTYKAADGLDIEAFVTLPANRPVPDKGLPCIVMPHGGPEGHDGLEFNWMAQALSARGYAVLQPNFRGSDNLGPDFVATGHGEWGRKMQSDLSDGVRALVKQGTIDAKRVAIAGASYGGYAALAGVAFDPGVYTCAVAIAPVSDLKSFVDWAALQEGKDYDSEPVLYWKRFMGDPSGWSAVSPAQHADAITVPVLLIHGKDDVTVPIEQSYRMRDALQHAGKPVQLVLLDHEDHQLSREVTRLQALTATVDFLTQHNP